MSSDEVIQKSLTGFMRDEKARDELADKMAQIQQKNEQPITDNNNVSSIADYNTQSTEQVLNFDNTSDGGLPARLPTEVMDTPPDDDDDDDNNQDSGGLPARLPTEVMDSPPDSNPTDDNEYEQNDDNEQQPLQQQEQQQQQVQQYDDNDNEDENVEMTKQETYYYMDTDGKQVGPISMDDVSNKYKNNEISDNTEIWSSNDTQNEKKPLKQNERIYSKLPKPPKRKTNVKKENNDNKYQQTDNIEMELQSSTDKNMKNNSGGKCCVIL